MPAWLIVTVQVPAVAPIVNVAPELVQSPELLKETGNPELAVAATVKLLFSSAVAGAGTVTVMA